MSERSRPFWPAYPLTVLIVGLGHGYLGQWKRGLAWFALYVLAIAFLSARTVTSALELGDPFVLTALQFEAVSYTDVAVPLSLLVVALLDIYLLGVTTRADVSNGSAANDTRSNGSS
jgi:hypothetical protein